MSAYNHHHSRWGDEQQAVPRAPRHDRHPGHAGNLPANIRVLRHPAPERGAEEAEAGEQAEVPDTEEYVFKGSTHPDMVLSGLNILRRENTFTDVKIKVEESEFSVHKCVLSSFSPYFKAMFTGGLVEAAQDVVTLHNVEPTMISGLIDYAYTGQITITKHNVQSMLSAANLLEILPVRDACCQFLDKNMDESNCLGIHCFAEIHSCNELMNKAKKYVLKHFQEIIEGDEFINITEAKLIEIISCDDLEVDKEETVFHACIKWLNNQQRVPKSFHNVLEHIRYVEYSNK